MITQQQIAIHLDMTQQAASDLMGRLMIDWRTSSLDEVRVAYIRHLREQAAGRSIDLSTERARLAKEQADRVAMQNAVTRGELAPAILIEEVLAKAAAKIAGVFDAIPGAIRRRVPSIPTEAIDLISGEIAKGRNMVAAMSLDDLYSDENGGDEGPHEEGV